MGKANLYRVFILVFYLGFSLRIVGEIPEFKKPVFIGKPDLTVSMKTPNLYQVQIFPDSDVRSHMLITVKNQGKAPAKDFSLEVFLSKSGLAGTAFLPTKKHLLSLGGSKVNIKSLAAGASLSVDFPGPVTIPHNVDLGDYYLLAGVDSESRIDEANEKNNIASLPLVICCRIKEAKILNFEDAGVCGKRTIYIYPLSGFSPSTHNVSVQLGGINVAVSYFVDDPSRKRIVCENVPISQIPLGTTTLYLRKNGMQVSNQSHVKMGILALRVEPSQGPAGTTVLISCCNAWSQGTKKLFLSRQGTSYTLLYEMAVTSWNMDLITATIPAVPPGTYKIIFKDQGEWFSSPPLPDFTVQQ